MPETQAERGAPRARALSDATKLDVSTRPRSHSQLDAFSPVNHDGCFEFDRVIKSGYVQKRTQKTKKWKTIYIVLRPNTLSMYKTDKEDKLRHQIYLSDLTAVASLKDPKQKRKNVFGLFSPSRNYHFQAPTPQDAHEWMDLIRKDARIEEEEDEMFLASPMLQRTAPVDLNPVPRSTSMDRIADHERFLSSSPEPLASPNPKFAVSGNRRRSSNIESSGLSGNELASHSDFSDNDVARLHGASIESLAVQSPLDFGSLPRTGMTQQPGFGIRSASQTSVANLEQDPDRVIWQGWLWFLRSKRGVKQWKHMWAVLRPRNLILYKDESEYTAQWILQLSAIVNVVDIDPLSKTKTNCLQVITEEKSYRFCAHDEESLVLCIGAFKSLLAKRRELEARVAASS
ncbi:Fc.00g076130.m01.CDS01 [Cosmosporella sp. VM-42]